MIYNKVELMDNERCSPKNNQMIRINFLLAIGIAFLHGNNCAYYGTSGVHMLLEEPILIATQTIVPLFFILAGVNFYKNANTLQQVFEKIKRRARSLLVPYLIWQMATWLFFSLIPLLPFTKRMGNGQELTVQSFFETVICGNNTNLWFLQRLIFAVLLSPLLWLFLQKAGFAIGLLVMEIAAWIMFSCGDTYSIIYAVFFFTLGMCVQKFDLVKYRLPPPVAIVGFLAVCILANLAGIIGYQKSQGIFAIPLFTVMSYLLWSSMQMISGKNIKPFERQSFLIYVTHGPIIVVLKKTLLAILGTSQWAALVSYVLGVTGTLFCVWVFYKIASRFFPKAYKVLTGGRS